MTPGSSEYSLPPSTTCPRPPVTNPAQRGSESFEPREHLLVAAFRLFEPAQSFGKSLKNFVSRCVLRCGSTYVVALRLDHIGFVPFALAKSLHADQVNAFASLFFNKADALVLYILYSVAHLKFWIAHII